MDKIYHGNEYESDVYEMPLSHMIARQLDEVWERRGSEGKNLWRILM
jgi:hypothetical protein